MKVFILISFISTLENPVPHVDPDEPIRFEKTFEQCVKVKDFREKYWIPVNGVMFFHTCVQMELTGYEEALRAFNRHIGDVL